MRYLLDVNTVLPLLDPRHVFLDSAHRWAASEPTSVWLTCPIVQNGVLRVACQPRYPNTLGTMQAVHEVMMAFVAHPRHLFCPDDVSLLDVHAVAKPAMLTPAALTDLYLLSLAIKHEARLATFDRRIQFAAIGVGARTLVLIQERWSHNSRRSLARESSLSRPAGEANPTDGRRLHQHGESQWLVHPVGAVVHRLQRQTNAQVSTRTLVHPKIPARHVVQNLVPAAEEFRGHRGGVVLHVDPVGDHHRCGENRLEHAETVVFLPTILVQESESAAVDAAGTYARRNDEGGVAREPSLGPHF